MANFVRKILQGEENKGVELTGGGGNVGEPGDEGGRLTVDSPDKVGIFDLKLKVNQERSCRQSSFLQGESGDGRKMLNTEFAESTEDTERKATAETDSKYSRDGTLVSLF
jgi:hypothetical protein